MWERFMQENGDGLAREISSSPSRGSSPYRHAFFRSKSQELIVLPFQLLGKMPVGQGAFPWNARCIAMHDREGGFILLDFLISMPMLVLLIGTVGVLSIFVARMASSLYADMELRQEVQSAFVRVIGDASEAYSVQRSVTGGGVSFRKRSLGKGDSQTTYFVSEKDRATKLVYGNAREPLTGDSYLAGVTITEFSWREVAPFLQEFRLTGKSRMTGHSYTLSTRVYGLRQEGRGSP